jgi:hypothetical protein
MKNMVNVSCFGLSTVFRYLEYPSLTLHLFLSALQAMCHEGTRKTRNWAIGSAISVQASKVAEWIRIEKGSSTKLVSLEGPHCSNQSGKGADLKNFDLAVIPLTHQSGSSS